MERVPAVILIGYRGSGKSSVARALAARWQTDAVDSDDRIARRAGASPAEIFARRGEAGFRELESAVLGELLADSALRIIATGGGIVERAENRAALCADARPVVYLAAPAPVLAARLSADPGGRPSLTGADVAAEVAAVLARREAWYQAVADHRVAAERPLAEVVAAVAAHVENPVE